MGVSGRNQTADLRIWRPNALPNSLITKINFMYSTTKLKICHLLYAISFQVAFDIANRIGILDVCQRLLHSVQSSLWLSDRASGCKFSQWTPVFFLFPRSLQIKLFLRKLSQLIMIKGMWRRIISHFR